MKTFDEIRACARIQREMVERGDHIDHDHGADAVLVADILFRWVETVLGRTDREQIAAQLCTALGIGER